MNSQFLLLFCLGLCAGSTGIKWKVTLPKVSLSAQPSSVVPTNGNVTLNCLSVPQDVYCNYQRQDTKLDPRTQLGTRKRRSRFFEGSAIPGSFNFHFLEVEESDSGYYTCMCYGYMNSNVSLRYSDEILILVTGHLPKPSLQAHQQRRRVAARGNVTLQCRKPHNMTEYKMFLLLKEGVSGPVQVQTSERNRADFLLRNVTIEDTGNYSCVYHQIGAPFWASHPSDLLEILVFDQSVVLNYFSSIMSVIPVTMLPVMMD